MSSVAKIEDTRTAQPAIKAVPDEPERVGGVRYARPKVAVDIIVFAVSNHRLSCYLIQLKRGPLSSRWAFPGGLVRVGESLDAAARRELASPTGLSDAYIEQLCTFGDPSRDPRSHVVSVAYMALISAPGLVKAPDKYADGKWFEVSNLPPLAYDHALMANYALKRLKAKLAYTNIAYSLLPEIFTFAEFEDLYATILGRQPDRRNFRRSIMAMGLLKELPMKRTGRHRPATLFSFATRSPQIIEML